jgi:hypothetical protein
MATSIPAAGYSQAPALPAAAPTAASRGWLLGPWTDLLFISNVSWPLVALFAAIWSDTQAYRAFGFMLAYFIIMPHRWLTLPVVFCDRQRIAQRPVAFYAVLLAVLLLCSTIQLSMSSLALLVAIDYLWNAWHFAAQHAGIARMYGRLSQPQDAGSGTWEKLLLRTFFLYVLLRVTGQFVPPKSFPWLEWVRDVMPSFSPLDFTMLLLPLGVLAADARRWGIASRGRGVYLASLTLLYGTLLVAIHFQQSAVIFGCAIAITLVHSTEYLTIVTWAVPRNRGLASTRIFAQIIPRWTTMLLGFMAFFAVTSWILQQSYVDRRWLGFWVWVNLTVSLLHYAYDGMIWKRPRKPQPA